MKLITSQKPRRFKQYEAGKHLPFPDRILAPYAYGKYFKLFIPGPIDKIEAKKYVIQEFCKALHVDTKDFDKDFYVKECECIPNNHYYNKPAYIVNGFVARKEVKE